MAEVFRARLRPPSPLAAAAALIALVALGIRGWVAAGGYFSLDDFVFYTRAGQSSMLDPDFLLASYNGHLMPGSMLWVWLTTRLAPLSFAPIVVTCLVLQAAVFALAYVVLRRLFGDRPAILVPFAVFAFTTVTLPALVWWAAALNQLPQQLSLLLALLGHLRYLRTERARDAFLAPLAVAGGLLFSEKSALTVPLLFVLTWLFLAGTPLWPALRQTLVRYRTEWIAMAALGVAYAVYYVTQVEGPVRGSASASQTVEALDTAARKTVLPGLLGGPWRWRPLGEVDSLASPHPLAQLVVLVLVGALVAYTVILARGAWRAWVLTVAALVLEVALLLFTRVQVVGVEAVAAEYRYFTDFGVVAVLAVGLALLPVTAPLRSGAEPVLVERDDESPIREALATVHRPTLAAVAVVALLISFTYSASTYRDRWAANPAKPFFANATADLREHNGDVTLYDGPVPTAVVWRLLWPATLPSRLFAPTDVDFTALAAGESTPDLRDIGADGHLRRSDVSGIAALPGPDGCGWQVDDDPVDVPLEADAFNWNWVIELHYTAAADTSVQLSAGDTSTLVEMPAASDTVYVAVTGELSSFTLADASGPVCVGSAVVGLPQPVEW